MKRPLIFTFSLGFLLGYFLLSFPLREWASYILVDDYPVVFVQSLRGWEILKQGGYFGWDPAFLGGYFTVGNIGTNLVHFLLPLSIFGWEFGYHLMLLLSFLAFPLLCFYYLKIYCGIDDKDALIAVPIAALFALSYFNDMLRWGRVAAFIAIDLTILALIFYARLKQGRRFSFFFLILTLTLLLYTHLVTLSFCLLLILIDLALEPGRKKLKYILYSLALLLVISLPALIYVIKYKSYFIFHVRDYLPKQIPTWGLYSYRIQSLMLSGPLAQYKIFAVPFLLYMAFKPRWKKEVFALSFFLLLPLVIPFNWNEWAGRVEYLNRFLVVVILSGFLIINRKKSYFAILYAALFAGLILSFPVKIYVFPHGKPGNFYNQPLIKKVKTLEGRYIAAENNQHWNHLGDKIVPRFHFLPLLQLETGKYLFSHMQDGYHFAVYRANSFEGGIFRGKPVTEWAIEDINDVLSKWGIRYLVLWNKVSKEYFSSHPNYYAKIWEDPDWVIFEYRDSDIKAVVVDNNGSGIIAKEDYFDKQIKLYNTKKGSRVTVRSNYFPAWKAYYDNKEIPVLNIDGQIGFKAPESGNYSIELKYPRYTIFNILAVISLALSGFLSYKKILP